MANRKFTKYPSGYVKASEEPHIVADDEIIEVYLCDGSEANCQPDTFYMEASTQYDVITIYSPVENYPSRYSPHYLMRDDQGIVATSTLSHLLSEFFIKYEVSAEDTKKIKRFAGQY